jgi:hypothetical protein
MHTWQHSGFSGARAVLSLTGDPTGPASKAIKIKTTITPLEGGWARTASFSGGGYGQTLTWQSSAGSGSARSQVIPGDTLHGGRPAVPNCPLRGMARARSDRPLPASVLHADVAALQPLPIPVVPLRRSAKPSIFFA